MTGDDYAHLAYLGILVGALALWFFTQNRQSLSRTIQQMAAWVFIFIAVIAAYGLWGDIRHTVVPQQRVMTEQGRIEVPRAQDGHYYMTLQVNDTPVQFVVDTGATSVVLSQEDAQRVGFSNDRLVYMQGAMTANGPVRTAPVTLERVSVGPFEDRQVGAVVNSGEMSQSLLGMTYLQRFDRVEIAGNRMILERG